MRAAALLDTSPVQLRRRPGNRLFHVVRVTNNRSLCGQLLFDVTLPAIDGVRPEKLCGRCAGLFNAKPRDVDGIAEIVREGEGVSNVP